MSKYSNGYAQDAQYAQGAFQPPSAIPPSGYLPPASPFAQADGPQGQGDHAQILPPGGPHSQQALQPHQDNAGTLTNQMADLAVGSGNQSVRAAKKKGRHAYHTLETPSAVQTYGSQFADGRASPMSLAQGQGQAQQEQYQQQPTSGAPGARPQFGAPSAPLAGAPASSAQGRVDPEQIPSVPLSRSAPAQFYLEHIYPTMEQHLPPPASIPFVAIDQGNSSPKFVRLTLNNIPASSEALNTTGLPLGLIVQPLAALQEGEQAVPVIDFGSAGPPRCRRCRAYINPFMIFRSGGNKFVCNMCTHANDTSPEYFAPTDHSGVRVDRAQRPELVFGTVDFTAPKEYWTREPVPLRQLFLIDVSMESVSKGFLSGVCNAILHALYGHDADDDSSTADETGDKGLATGSRIGIVTFDREAHFYDLSPKLHEAKMVVMPDLEDPFVPISGGLFVHPNESKHVIVKLLKLLPTIFEKVKYPEPALLPCLNAALEALKGVGGKVICSLAALPTWGPGRLFLRERPELRDTDGERKLYMTEHPGFIKLAKQMTENGIGVDFFMAAPQGGYLDIATIGHVSELTGGEIFYYPNFHAPRDHLRLAKDLKHTVLRDTGFQALMKVRCSNGLQVSAYHGNFTQHAFGADLEFGTIDSDKAFGVTFSYDGKLDPKLDAHFQSALLYTSASGQRRIRCSNICASVSESALESMKLADQDAVVALLAKQTASKMTNKLLKDVRNQLIEKSIDILAAYRRNFSGSHPPGQLVLPENLKEFAMYTLGLLKSRAIKGGQEPSDRRVVDMRLLKGMGAQELSLYLYPRIISLHNLAETDGFPNDNGHLRVPHMLRASYSRVEEGGVYLVDCGQICLLWLHAQVSPNLLVDLFGEGKDSLQSLDPYSASIPVLDTHLNAQVRNILQYLEDNRGSKGLTIQIARQGFDGAEYEFARLLYEDRNNEERSYVDWLVHLHRHIQMEGQRKKEDGSENALTNLTGLRPPYW